MNQNNNTQLPKEVVEQISAKAKDIANGLPIKCDGDVIYKVGYEEGHVAGATELANKLHELQGKFLSREEMLRDMAQAHKIALDLLAEVFQKHESGLLPDRFVYDKIKKFLYGE